MKPPTTFAIVGLAFTAVLASPSFAADAAKPSADQILRQMSDTIGAARQIRFAARRHLDIGLVPSLDVPEDAKIKVLVQRPNKIAAESSGQDAARSFYADGRTATLVDRKNNLYATIPMKTSIDGLVARLDARFGFTPPLAEFVVSDSYNGMSKLIRKSSVAGTENVGWTECYHLVLIGDLADAGLWVGVKDHLPRRLIATFKQLEGQPQLRVDFSDWNLAASASDQDFAFVRPNGSQKIDMISTSDTGKPSRKSAAVGN